MAAVASGARTLWGGTVGAMRPMTELIVSTQRRWFADDLDAAASAGLHVRHDWGLGRVS